MPKTLLLLTRHGETLENKRHIMQGHTPGTLSPLGIEQAHQLAESLTGEIVDVIVSSDLARSYDTAKIVGDRLGLEPVQTPLLREIDWGKYTGGILTELDWGNLPEGCESLSALLLRAEKFVNWLRREYTGKRILAVGHGAIDRAVIAYLEGKNEIEMVEMPIMDNTAIVKLGL